MDAVRWSERRGKKIVRERSGGWCEGCDRRPAVDWHHRQNRSQGGGWNPSNGMHLCRPCHRFVNHYPERARNDLGWSIRRAADPTRERVWLARHGWCLLSDAGDITPLDRPVWDPWIGQPPELFGMPVVVDPRLPPDTALIMPIDREET